MRLVRLTLVGLLLVLTILGLTWLARAPQGTRPVVAGSSSAPRALRLGLIPERDIYQQRKNFRALADYLSAKLGEPVELVTSNTYQGILQDLEEHQVDAAFLGSLVAMLAQDRLGAQVLVKPEYANGSSTYAGVLFVPADSPIQNLEQLRGHSMAGVKATTGAALYPISIMVDLGVIHDNDAPRLTWVGTHDDVIREVMAGRVHAGAVKDTRLSAFEENHPQFKVRRLASSCRVPENALIVRGDMPPAKRENLRRILLAMNTDPAGHTVLAGLELARYIDCQAGEYQGLFAMIQRVGPAWSEVGIGGPAPKAWPPGATTVSASAPASAKASTGASTGASTSKPADSRGRE